MSRYVQITREEIEEWLNSLRMKWELREDTEGIYFIHPPKSKNVVIKFSSSVGRRDAVVSRAKGSMTLALASSKKSSKGYYPILNKKAVGQKFYRTKNWRKSLEKGIKALLDAYVKSKDFYEKIADKEAYLNAMSKIIRNIDGWENRSDLKRYMEMLEKGQVLNSSQEGHIEDVIREGVRAPNNDPAVLNTSKGVDENFLNRLRMLYKRSSMAEDGWMVQFSESVGKQYKAKGTLSPKQMKVVEMGFKKYRVPEKAGKK